MDCRISIFNSKYMCTSSSGGPPRETGASACSSSIVFLLLGAESTGMSTQSATPIWAALSTSYAVATYAVRAVPTPAYRTTAFPATHQNKTCPHPPIPPSPHIFVSLVGLSLRCGFFTTRTLSYSGKENRQRKKRRKRHCQRLRPERLDQTSLFSNRTVHRAKLS